MTDDKKLSQLQEMIKESEASIFVCRLLLAGWYSDNGVMFMIISASVSGHTDNDVLITLKSQCSDNRPAFVELFGEVLTAKIESYGN